MVCIFNQYGAYTWHAEISQKVDFLIGKNQSWIFKILLVKMDGAVLPEWMIICHVWLDLVSIW